MYPVLRAVENTATKPAVEVTAMQVWQVKQHQNVRCYAMLCVVLIEMFLKINFRIGKRRKSFPVAMQSLGTLQSLVCCCCSALLRLPLPPPPISNSQRGRAAVDWGKVGLT